MTKEQIVKLAIENNLVVEVYGILHYIVIAELCALQDKSDRINSELRLVRKFADANKLDVIKDILSKEGENDGQHIDFKSQAKMRYSLKGGEQE